jgi:predicted nucleotidyltransferase
MRNTVPSTGARIDEIVRRIVARFDPEQIVLFGSRARGEAGPDSDVDLLIVMPVTGSKRDKRVEVRLALHDIPGGIDIVVSTPDEVRRRRNVVGTIERAALREGEVLYARRS